MKLDIVRAWKDENYRQSLDNEEINALPASPVGDLELKSVNGSGGFPGGGGIGGVGGVGGTAGFFGASSSFFHSVAFECNQNTFSLVFNDALNISTGVGTEVHCTNHSNNHERDFIGAKTTASPIG